MNVAARLRDTRDVDLTALGSYVTPTVVPRNTAVAEPQMVDAASVMRYVVGSKDVHRVRHLGKGLLGGVYSAPLTPDIKAHLVRCFKMLESKVGSADDLPDAGTVVAIKFVPFTKNDRHLFSEFLRELRVGLALSVAAPVRVGDKIYDVSSVVPKLYCGGYLKFGGSARVGVSVMAVAPGKPMTHMIDRERVVPVWVTAGLEYAICCIFLAGYIHADLHLNNIFADPQTKRVVIIDFGRSIRMSEHMRAAFKRYLLTRKDDAIDAFWDEVAQPYGDSVIRARSETNRRRHWWTDVTLARTLADHTMGNLTAERARLWVLD